MRDLLLWIVRPVRWVFHWLVALIVLFEEWGWEPLSRWMGRWVRCLHLDALERRIAALPPKAALAVFALPSVLLLPIKLAAVGLMSRGHVSLGIAVIVLAKLGGTAVVARLFQLVQPALMQIPWFARYYTRWTVWKEALLVKVRASRPWRVGRVLKRQIKFQVQRLKHGIKQHLGGD